MFNRTRVISGYSCGVASCVSFFFSSRRRHTRSLCDWSSDVCSSDLGAWAFYRLSQRSAAAPLADHLVSLLPADDPGLALDLERLEGVKRSRAAVAAEDRKSVV